MTTHALPTDAQERLEQQKLDQRYRLWRTLIRAAATVGCVWLMAEAVGELAGKDTSVVVRGVLSVFADIKFVVSVALAGCAAAWAVLERWLRHRKVEHLQARVIALEQQIDPNRSSSGLTAKGQTHPADRG